MEKARQSHELASQISDVCNNLTNYNMIDFTTAPGWDKVVGIQILQVIQDQMGQLNQSMKRDSNQRRSLGNIRRELDAHLTDPILEDTPSLYSAHPSWSSRCHSGWAPIPTTHHNTEGHNKNIHRSDKRLHQCESSTMSYSKSPTRKLKRQRK